MTKWLMNMPVSPEKDSNGDYSKKWIDWVKGRHPDEVEYAINEWTKFLEDKIIGEPRSQARPAKEYKAEGWVGIYEGIARVEGIAKVTY